jgi:predicted DNA-binding transcriptional regulator AlpA
MSQQEISRTLHMERKTICRLVRAGQFPERVRRVSIDFQVADRENRH